MIVDSHCHLDHDPLYKNLDEVIKRANNVGVQYFLTISTTLKSFEVIKKIVSRYKKVFGTIGIHPHETSNYSDLETKTLIKLIKNQSKIIGIGETGLDFFYNHSEKSIQKEAFIKHIHTAMELDIPLIIHSRNAEKETYDILKYEGLNNKLKILMHCFTGSKEFAKKMLDLGAYISFSGIITFKNSASLNEAASCVPLNRLLIETDSPYLSPVPNRGKVNEPSFIKYTAEQLSIIKKTNIIEISEKTSQNFFKLFSFV